MPRRERFTTEVGPDARGSKPVMEVCAQTPERSGCALPPAGCAAWVKPDAVAVSATRKRMLWCRILRRASLASPVLPQASLHAFHSRVNWAQTGGKLL